MCRRLGRALQFISLGDQLGPDCARHARFELESRVELIERKSGTFKPEEFENHYHTAPGLK